MRNKVYILKSTGPIFAKFSGLVKHMCMRVRPTPENVTKIGPLDYGIIDGVSGIVKNKKQQRNI